MTLLYVPDKCNSIATMLKKSSKYFPTSRVRIIFWSLRLKPKQIHLKTIVWVQKIWTPAFRRGTSKANDKFTLRASFIHEGEVIWFECLNSENKIEHMTLGAKNISLATVQGAKDVFLMTH